MANKSMICSAVNASFDIGIEFSGDVGSVTYQNSEVLPASYRGILDDSNAIQSEFDDLFSIASNIPGYFFSLMAFESNVFGNL